MIPVLASAKANAGKGNVLVNPVDFSHVLLVLLQHQSRRHIHILGGVLDPPRHFFNAVNDVHSVQQLYKLIIPSDRSLEPTPSVQFRVRDDVKEDFHVAYLKYVKVITQR